MKGNQEITFMQPVSWQISSGVSQATLSDLWVIAYIFPSNRI
jgi:hypothetical protein